MNLKEYLSLNKPLSFRKGKHTTAYIYEAHVTIHTNDYIKECMAHDWFPESIHLPQVNQSDIESLKDDYMVYQMPRYITSRSVSSIICKEDYVNLYQPLQSLYRNLQYSTNPYDWHIDFVNTVNKLILSDEYKELLIESYEACMNYSHKIRFEISPRNVAAHGSRLLLLDCFYIAN